MANVEYVAGDIEIGDVDELSQSADNLKVIVTAGGVTENELDSTTEGASDSSLESCTSEDHQSSDESKENTIIETIEPAKNAITIPDVNYLKKKSRLISTDSGFGSYGRSELYSTGSIDSVATITMAQHKTNTTSVHTKPITNYHSSSEHIEKQDKISPLAVSQTAATKFVQRYEKIKSYQKNRNTTMNSIDDSINFELDAKLINRSDGFKDIQCYFDEHGSPKVREKNSRKKSTLKQELKARSLGASYDNDTLRKIHQNKTPSCVSFTRLCKKFKETFCSK